MYGGKIMNDGKDSFSKVLFENSYQNDEEEGNKMFLILWLHAYRYQYRDLVVKT
jgi:hypothetical protein